MTVAHPQEVADRPRPADLMPPFALPAAHFATGLAWLGLGALGLLLVQPELARGGFLSPHVVAVTHCFTLGWITTSIFGALYQLFPVALGVPARSIRVGHAALWILTAGIATLIVGSWLWGPSLLAAGWVLLFLAVGAQSWNLLPQRRRAPRGRTIGLYISAGHIGLGLAMLVVAARIGTGLGWWEVGGLNLLSAHVHLALGAFATITVVGVSSKLFPMFLLSRNHPEWPLRWIGPLLFGGMAFFAAGELANLGPLETVGAWSAALGIALYLYLAAGYFRTRTRRVLEPGLAHAAVALAFLGAATVLGVILLARPTTDARLIGAYGVLGVLGWLTILVVGMYYKIVPFLTWLHHFSHRVGEAGVPKVADLTRAEFMWGTLVALSGAVILLAVGIALGSVRASGLGAALFAGGVMLVLAQHLRLALVR